jgi:hypothetical protein
MPGKKIKVAAAFTTHSLQQLESLSFACLFKE